MWGFWGFVFAICLGIWGFCGFFRDCLGIWTRDFFRFSICLGIWGFGDLWFVCGFFFQDLGIWGFFSDLRICWGVAFFSRDLFGDLGIRAFFFAICLGI